MSNYRKDGLEKFADAFRALSNPNRLRMFLRMAKGCCANRQHQSEQELRACVGEISRDMGIAASTVSHHIKELRQAGLIRMERRGQKVECWVDPERLDDLASFFSEGVLDMDTDEQEEIRP